MTDLDPLGEFPPDRPHERRVRRRSGAIERVRVDPQHRKGHETSPRQPLSPPIGARPPPQSLRTHELARICSSLRFRFSVPVAGGSTSAALILSKLASVSLLRTPLAFTSNGKSRPVSRVGVRIPDRVVQVRAGQS